MSSPCPCVGCTRAYKQARVEQNKETLELVERVLVATLNDRYYDMINCNKDDDCYAKAQGVELALSDVLHELKELWNEGL